MPAVSSQTRCIPSVIQDESQVCIREDSPFSYEFPYHADPNTAAKHFVQNSVASSNRFAAITYDISEKARWAIGSMRNGIKNILHGLRC
jgi:hypothetical protein